MEVWEIGKKIPYLCSSYEKDIYKYLLLVCYPLGFGLKLVFEKILSPSESLGRAFFWFINWLIQTFT